MFYAKSIWPITGYKPTKAIIVIFEINFKRAFKIFGLIIIKF